MAINKTQKLYEDFKSNKISESKFLYEIRRDTNLPINNTNNFKDSVKILKNKRIIWDTPVESKSFEINEYLAEAKKKEKVKLNPDQINWNEWQKGIQVELDAMKGNDPITVKLEKAQKKALENLNKDQMYYLRLQSGQPAVKNRTDVMIPLNKKGDNLKDEGNEWTAITKLDKANVTDTGDKYKAKKLKTVGAWDTVAPKTKLIKEHLSQDVFYLDKKFLDNEDNEQAIEAWENIKNKIIKGDLYDWSALSDNQLRKLITAGNIILKKYNIQEQKKSLSELLSETDQEDIRNWAKEEVKHELGDLAQFVIGVDYDEDYASGDSESTVIYCSLEIPSSYGDTDDEIAKLIKYDSHGIEGNPGRMTTKVIPVEIDKIENGNWRVEVEIRNVMDVEESKKQSIAGFEKRAVQAAGTAKKNNLNIVSKYDYDKDTKHQWKQDLKRPKETIDEGSYDEFLTHHGKQCNDVIKKARYIAKKVIDLDLPENEGEASAHDLQKHLKNYDDSISSYVIEHLLFNGGNWYPSASDLARVALNNMNYTGTEMNMILSCFEDAFQWIEKNVLKGFKEGKQDVPSYSERQKRNDALKASEDSAKERGWNVANKITRGKPKIGTGVAPKNVKEETISLFELSGQQDSITQSLYKQLKNDPQWERTAVIELGNYDLTPEQKKSILKTLRGKGCFNVGDIEFSETLEGPYGDHGSDPDEGDNENHSNDIPWSIIRLFHVSPQQAAREYPEYVERLKGSHLTSANDPDLDPEKEYRESNLNELSHPEHPTHKYVRKDGNGIYLYNSPDIKSKNGKTGREGLYSSNVAPVKVKKQTKTETNLGSITSLATEMSQADQKLKQLKKQEGDVLQQKGREMSQGQMGDDLDNLYEGNESLVKQLNNVSQEIYNSNDEHIIEMWDELTDEISHREWEYTDDNTLQSLIDDGKELLKKGGLYESPADDEGKMFSKTNLKKFEKTVDKKRRKTKPTHDNKYLKSKGYEDWRGPNPNNH